ncbi:M14 family metallopeptidase [Piscinibacter koreensis]|uniref:M14 family metallopeptidase n=1 Tax=Piscinibacter koreensis TaxID=2742824 RepID=UPI0031582CA1
MLQLPAVQARFPAPSAVYATPGLAPGATRYTSNREVAEFLRELEGASAASGTFATVVAAGTSQRGEPIEALVLARGVGMADVTTTGLAANRRPTVLLIGQQHGDEPAPAEALLVVARQLLSGPLSRLLDRINVVVLPRANPDAAQAGQRLTANGIDANRDHLLLRTSEARAQARLIEHFDPVVIVDAHEYPALGRWLEAFGALPRADALFQFATTANVDPFITRAAEEWFRQPLIASMLLEGLALDWYHTLPDEGPVGAERQVAMGGTRADSARNVQGLRNAVSLLIESRGRGLGPLHLERRVHTHVTALASILASAANRADELVKLRALVDQRVAGLACRGEVLIDAAPTPSEYELTLINPATGADKKVAVGWDSALALTPLKTRRRPCGYWLDDREETAAERLRALGVQILRVDEAGELRAEGYRDAPREPGRRVDAVLAIGSAGANMPSVQTVRALVDAPAGSYYISLEQPLANLVVAALEPDSPVSFVTHGLISSLASVARVLGRPELRMSPIP